MIKRLVKMTAIVCGAALLGLLWLAWAGSNFIQLSHYRVSVERLPESFQEELRIVHISDLHGKEFGKNNERLARAIAALEPDLILASGDLISSRGDDGSAFINLLKELKGLCPVYCSLGNHEQILRMGTGAERYENFTRQLRERGAVLLDNERVVLDWDGTPVAIYGLTAMLYHYSGRNTAPWDGGLLTAEFIEEAIGRPQESELTILLAHNPKYFPEYARWGADLVFSGHVHGGVIRLPYLGGLFSPDLTFFPPYDAGLYSQGKTQMHVSRGLGNSVIPVRIFNRPDVSLVIVQDARR